MQLLKFSMNPLKNNRVWPFNCIEVMQSRGCSNNLQKFNIPFSERIV